MRAARLANPRKYHLFQTQPQRIEVAHNVMTNIGHILIHVAGVGLRSASHCHVHHNRIAGSPRYGLQADSFFKGEGGGPPDNSRFNLLEFNSEC